MVDHITALLWRSRLCGGWLIFLVRRSEDRSAGHHIILTAAPSREAFPFVFSFRFSGRQVVGNVESLCRSRTARTFEAFVTVKRP